MYRVQIPVINVNLEREAALAEVKRAGAARVWLSTDARGIEDEAYLQRELELFSNQKLILRLHRQREELETFRLCENKARELVARMEVLSQMGRPGRLDAENRRRLSACGAEIRDQRPLDSVLERDVVTNYHVRQILTRRRELLDALKK